MKLRGGRRIEAPTTISNKKAKTLGSTNKKKKKRADLSRPTTRSNESQESPSLATTTITPLDRRNTRTTKPSCFNFGLDRKVRYRGFFFCSNCDWWDTDRTLRCRKKKGPMHVPRRYQCIANHSSWCFPTQRQKSLMPFYHTRLDKKKKRDDDDIDHITERNSDTDHITERNSADVNFHFLNEEETHEFLDETDNNQQHSQNDDTQDAADADDDGTRFLVTPSDDDNNDVEFLRRKLKASQQQCKRLQQQVQGLTTNISEPVQRNLLLKRTVCLLTQNYQLPQYQRVTDKKLASIITDLAWGDEFLGGEVRNLMITKTRQYLREHVYPPQSVLRAMDFKGGQLSSHGIEVLLELDFPGVKRAYNKVLPSPASLKRTAAIVEHYGNHICPYTTGFLPNGGGEFVEFDVKAVLSLIVKSFQLEEVAKTRSIGLSQSIDGAQLNKRDTHVLYGLKVNDKAAICPVTKRPIFANSDKTILQSRNNCFPVKMIMARETMQIYQEFKILFDTFKNEGTVEESLLGDDYLPINVATNCDLSATWKALGRGGAAKRNLNPCQCCEITSANLVKPNTVLCDRWCRQFGRSEEENGFKCYHHEMLSEPRMQSMREEMEEIKNDLKELVNNMEEIARKSNIKNKDDPRSHAFGNSIHEITSIHYYVEERTRDQVRTYSRYLTLDLILRDLDTNGSLEERRERLKECLVLEYSYTSLQSAINHGDKGTENALFVLINAVPCILHMENRVGLKVLTRLLMNGLDNAKQRTIYLNEESENQRILFFIKDVEHVLNTQAWGTVESPSQWQCSYNPADKQIDIICLDNVRTRKAIYALDNLIDVCLPDIDDASKWKISIGHYRTSMELLRQKEDFTDEQIHLFQKACDDFFQTWVDINAVEGVTNYIHMLGSGHVSDYLFHWRNLYAHSQQGWEAFNALVKTYYFRRTNRGGAGNKGTGQRSKLKGLARWMQRRMVWFSGVTYEEMVAFYDQRNVDDNAGDEADNDQEDDAVLGET
jgi:hypothetical protein